MVWLWWVPAPPWPQGLWGPHGVQDVGDTGCVLTLGTQCQIGAWSGCWMPLLNGGSWCSPPPPILARHGTACPCYAGGHLGDRAGPGCQVLSQLPFTMGSSGETEAGATGLGEGQARGGGPVAPAGPRARLSRLPPRGLFIARAAMCWTHAVARGSGRWVQTRLCSTSLPFAMLGGYGGPCPLTTPWG